MYCIALHCRANTADSGRGGLGEKGKGKGKGNRKGKGATDERIYAFAASLVCTPLYNI